LYHEIVQISKNTESILSYSRKMYAYCSLQIHIIGYAMIKCQTPQIGWEINMPLQHKNRLYQRQGVGWRSSFARLKMANDIVTSWHHSLFLQWRPKMGKDRGRSFKLLRQCLQQGGN